MSESDIRDRQATRKASPAYRFAHADSLLPVSFIGWFGRSKRSLAKPCAPNRCASSRFGVTMRSSPSALSNTSAHSGPPYSRTKFSYCSRASFTEPSFGQGDFNLDLRRTFSPPSCGMAKSSPGVQRDKGNSEIMLMDRGIADAGAMGDHRSRLVNRRAFLLGSAAGLAALGAGRLRIRLHEPGRGGESLRAGARREIPDPCGRCQQGRSEIFSQDREGTTALRRPVRSLSIPANTMSTASKARETRPAMAPMSAVMGSGGAGRLMSDARPNGRPGRRPRR